MSTITADSPQTTSPTREELVARAAALVPLLKQNAEPCENEGRLPKENVDALVDAGLLKLTLPRRFGGYEADTHTKVAVYSELGKGCSSTAWVSGLWSDGTLFTSLFPDEVQDEILGADPDVRITVSFPLGGTVAISDGDGYRLSGRWPFNTGCAHATWAIRSAVIDPESDAPGFGMFLVPYEGMTILDDWQTSGLCGTGSNTVIGEDIYVPAERMIHFGDAKEGRFKTVRNADSPLYRTPIVSTILTTGSLGFPGVAKAALEVFMERLPGRPITYTTYGDQSRAPIRHHQAAEAAMRIRAADHLTFEVADIVDRHAAEGSAYAAGEQAQLWGQVAYATQLYSEAVEILRAASGASAIHRSSPMQRIARDAAALKVHAIMSPTSGLEFYGRALCGLEPNSPLL
ncbi:acyl-CoA dehydrogenase family protein [Pseudonocardia sp. H11422]|uniref:acyl-CoA dehydrogenase family protein n=1 Tax=Pseudonocardia sp. H11422 TaxID=2835866 RepID=UPI001BDBE5DC|nr:acyl-CoA dehydrogenase family protein [Pseudonocardia sp. H11422]